MAVSSLVYGSALLSLFNGEINYSTATVKAMLVTSTYVPNQDTHRYKSSVTNEVTGTGYTAGGATLTSKTIAYDSPSNTVTLDCADLTWSTSTITARYLVFYVSTGTDATSPLLAYVDFGTNVVSSSSTFTYVVPANGFAQFTVS